MQIADLRIENFRGIKTGHVRFGGHTVLVGPNNCGKTTVIEALALLFGRDRMVRPLTEHDFFGSDPQPADRIRLIATVIGFDGNDPAEHLEWFRDDRGVPKWWDPGRAIASPTRDEPGWQLSCQIGFCARFDREDLEVETVRYFHDDDAAGDVFLEENHVVVPHRLIRDVGFFLVPASRTWDRVVSFGSELFRRVVVSAGAKPAESVIGERDRLRKPNQALEVDPHLAPIVEQLNAELAGFFHAAPTLQLRVTSTDSDGLLEAVVPHYAQSGSSHGLPARRHGSGLLSLQHLLLLLQFGRQRARAGEGFWMEEPELHVPPPLQRRLVHRIQALSTQTFVSTHSPMVAAMSDPTEVLVMRNENGTVSAVPLLPEPLASTAPNAVRKLFQLNRGDTIAALMHDAVLVPEGRIDHAWLNLLLRAVDLKQGWTEADESRFGAHVGLVPTHDGAVVATVAALRPLHPRASAVVDGDTAGLGYVKELIAGAREQRPRLILRWPDGWTVEDVVGWILEADPSHVIPTLAKILVPAPESVAALVARLKSEDRATNGLKQDHVAYEAIADVIGANDPCCRRAREFLNAMTDVLLGGTHGRFVARSEGLLRQSLFPPKTLVLQP
jgi:predicted ATPase